MSMEIEKRESFFHDGIVSESVSMVRQEEK